jgi:hypothetical protein
VVDGKVIDSPRYLIFVAQYISMMEYCNKKEAQRPLFWSETVIFDQAKLSAQILWAQPQAYTPSKVDGAGDRPPDPGTVLKVFSAALY